mgnify:CR=1 FL=1
MGAFVKGDVVIAPFPYSDLTTSKKRPAIVLATLEGDDVILCQITSQSRVDPYSISLLDKDFESGSLKQDSFIRPNRIFTADSRIVLYKGGVVSRTKLKEVVDKVISILKS